jgi:hypothetical protein
MNDRIAEISDRLCAKAEAGVDLLDDQEANALADELTVDEHRELMTLVGQRLGHEEEIVEAKDDELDAIRAAIEVRKQLDRGEIDRREAERRVREIDHASGGAVSRRWKL